METLVVIPARSGSKGVKRKNMRPLLGRPLIYYTIKVALEIFDRNQIIVSTDDLEIKNYAEELGLKVPFIRPAHLSSDTASTNDVLLHALDFFEKENNYSPTKLILLQPTSPLRTSRHIKGCLNLFNPEIDMVVSVKETSSNPYYVLFEEDRNGYLLKSKPGKFTRRQDCPRVWEYNGAVYVISISSLKKKAILDFTKVVKYIMKDEDSIDIDSELDFVIVEELLKRNK